ncbi:protein of unknown function [Nitrospira japonica]|uniref:Uncharacterized protein n=1 Tax=Nitrospira japonica TaxID=1325564 RepID=A0A1W1I887_9BACT|nr:hypothetical protein [Nitrospira japonica]SLM49227.1 protein of unknown function [Nitrospira japonica]
MSMPTATPSEFITRVDFGKYWDHFLGAGPLDAISRRALVQAKDELLTAGVPTFTVIAYFRHLYYRMGNDVLIGLVEEIISDLEDLAHLEESLEK